MRRYLAFGLVVCLVWGLAGCLTETAGGALVPASPATSDGELAGLTRGPVATEPTSHAEAGAPKSASSVAPSAGRPVAGPPVIPPSATPVATSEPPVAAPNPLRPGQMASSAGERLAGLLVSSTWECPFPAEADNAKIDRAVVALLVRVAADGTPKAGKIVVDPGYGFGAAASYCAMTQKYTPARDAQGNPVEGFTPPIRVNFVR